MSNQSIQCECGKRIGISAGQCGSFLTCPDCGNKIAVPSLSTLVPIREPHSAERPRFRFSLQALIILVCVAPFFVYGVTRSISELDERANPPLYVGSGGITSTGSAQDGNLIIAANQVRLAQLVEYLESRSGRAFEIASEIDSNHLVTITARGKTWDELLSRIAEQTSVRFDFDQKSERYRVR